MTAKNLKIVAYALSLIVGITSCSKDDSSNPNNPNDPNDPNNPNNPTAGRYVHWESESMGGYYTANLVKNGKIYQTPYTYSADGVSWTTDGSDGLNRTFENLNGGFWTERSNSSGDTFYTYTALNGSGSITINADTYNTGISTSAIAWEGGNTVYAYSNNSGGVFGGNYDDDYIVKSTDGGSTWTPLTYQPPQATGFVSYDKIWLIDNKLFVLERIHTTNGYTRYKLYVTSGGGTNNDWSSSSDYETSINLQKVVGVGGTAIYATVNDGTYKVVFNGTVFTFEAIEFESGYNFAGKLIALASENGGNNLLGFYNTYGFYIPDAVTTKFYNPSLDGSYSLPGVGGIVVFGNQLVVTAGSSVYKTPYPFVFHENP